MLFDLSVYSMLLLLTVSIATYGTRFNRGIDLAFPACKLLPSNGQYDALLDSGNLSSCAWAA